MNSKHNELSQRVREKPPQSHFEKVASLCELQTISSS